MSEKLTKMMIEAEKVLFVCLSAASPLVLFLFPNPTSPIALASAVTLFLICLVILFANGSLTKGNLVQGCFGILSKGPQWGSKNTYQNLTSHQGLFCPKQPLSSPFECLELQGQYNASASSPESATPPAQSAPRSGRE